MMVSEAKRLHLSYTLKDESWGIYCTSVDSISETPAEQLDSVFGGASGRSNTEYQFFYLISGTGVFRCGGVEEELQPGVFLVIAPDLWHWIIPDRDSIWSAAAVAFSGKNAASLAASHFCSAENPVHRTGVREPLISVFSRMRETAEHEPPCFQHILGSLVLEALALALSYDATRVQTAQGDQIIEKGKALLGEHLFKRVDMEQIAESIGVSYKAFCDLFRQYTGMTPYQYFLNIKINKAKELLEEGQLSVKEVSYKLAFQTPYYFSRFFKIKTGVPPFKWNGLDLEDL